MANRYATKRQGSHKNPTANRQTSFCSSAMMASLASKRIIPANIAPFSLMRPSSENTVISGRLHKYTQWYKCFRQQLGTKRRDLSHAHAPVSPACCEIVWIVSWRHFHSTSSKCHVHKHAVQDDGDLPVVERMLQHLAMQGLQGAQT